jgi:hypothetical protein
MRSELTTQIDNMLKQDIIELSESPWSSPIVLVRKKNGTMRLYIGYRKVNDVMKKDSFPASCS